MGTIKQGILGGFSGKVGTVVGSTWKSVHYMRALAVSFSDPRTEKQKNQRSKFTAAVNFTKAMTPFLRFGYKEFSGQQSAFNAAVSYILKHAMKGSGRNVSIDYNKALVTRGSLVPALDATVTVNESKVTFAWTDNSGMGDATVTDAAMLLAYNKDKGMAVYDIAAATLRCQGRTETSRQLEGRCTGHLPRFLQRRRHKRSQQRMLARHSGK